MATSLLVPHARDVARDLLADLPERWAHAQGVGRRAEELARLAGLLATATRVRALLRAGQRRVPARTPAA